MSELKHTLSNSKDQTDFERERMTRRQALKKLGITSAMATFAMFSIDYLAHMVGSAMHKTGANSKLVEQVAMELDNAGVAMASWSGNVPCVGSYTGTSNQGPCTDLSTNPTSVSACEACNGERAGVCWENLDSLKVATCPPNDGTGGKCGSCNARGTEACAGGGNLWNLLNSAWENCGGCGTYGVSC